MKDFKKLIVWQKSHHLVLDIYKLTNSFPKEEVYGLTSQIRRSAASIPINIAEGSGRKTDGDFSRFLTISAGSASELSYQILLSFELGYLSLENYTYLNSNLTEIMKILNVLIKKTS